MGMFNRLYDEEGNEWQTKAFDCSLADYRIGEEVVFDASSYQVEILGGPDNDPFQDSYATVKNGYIASVNDARDHRLPLVGYDGMWVNARNEG